MVVISEGEHYNQIPGSWVDRCVLHVCVGRVVTYPWAAEGAGGEARGGSTNRPRPVAQTRKNTHRGRGNWWDQHVYL